MSHKNSNQSSLADSLAADHKAFLNDFDYIDKLRALHMTYTRFSRKLVCGVGALENNLLRNFLLPNRYIFQLAAALHIAGENLGHQAAA